MPVAYIPRTRELYSAYTPYRWVVNEEPPPWTPLRSRSRNRKVALMSSGGILYRDQPRFHREDASYRLIPKNAQRDDLTVWHFGYPTADAENDPNCVFPLARMREFEAAGRIGELADPAFSFHGRDLFGAQGARGTRAANRRRTCSAQRGRLLPGARLTRLPSVRWTDCPSGRSGRNPDALYDFGARHHASRQSAARGIRQFPARPSDRQTARSRYPARRSFATRCARSRPSSKPGTIVELPYVWDANDRRWEETDYTPGFLPPRAQEGRADLAEQERRRRYTTGNPG